MKILIIIFLAAHICHSETLHGVARNSKGEIAYTETHQIQRDKNGDATYLETDYADASGKKIARIVANFKAQPYVPNSKYEDFRFDRVFDGVYKEKGQNRLYTVTETLKGKIVKTTELKVENNLISGSGFDNFIFNELIKKNTNQASVQFLVLPRHDFYKFKVEKLKSDSTSDDHFQIKPSGFILNIFVKKIDIHYAKGTRRLVKYQGLSNLPNNKDDSQEVTIEYDKEK